MKTCNTFRYYISQHKAQSWINSPGTSCRNIYMNTKSTCAQSSGPLCTTDAQIGSSNQIALYTVGVFLKRKIHVNFGLSDQLTSNNRASVKKTGLGLVSTIFYHT